MVTHVFGSVIIEDTIINESIKIEFEDGSINEVLDLSYKELSQLLHNNVNKYNKKKFYIKMEVNRDIDYEGLVTLTILITVKNNNKSTIYYVSKFLNRIKFEIKIEGTYNKVKYSKTIISTSMFLEYQNPNEFDAYDLIGSVYLKEEYIMQSKKPSRYCPIMNLINILPKKDEEIILNKNYFESIF